MRTSYKSVATYAAAIVMLLLGLGSQVAQPTSALAADSIKAPVAAGISVTVIHGYNDPPPNQTCPPPGAGIRDHCMNQKYGLDLQPHTSDPTVVSPTGGSIAWVQGDCLGLTTATNLNMTICHFASFDVHQGQGVGQGQPLGKRSTTWIHMSLDNRASLSPGTPLRNAPPVPFSGANALEGFNFYTMADSVVNQWVGQVITSTNTGATGSTPSTTITGAVWDGATGRGAPNVDVKLSYGNLQGQTVEVRTDRNGHYDARLETSDYQDVYNIRASESNTSLYASRYSYIDPVIVNGGIHNEDLTLATLPFWNNRCGLTTCSITVAGAGFGVDQDFRQSPVGGGAVYIDLASVGEASTRYINIALLPPSASGTVLQTINVSRPDSGTYQVLADQIGISSGRFVQTRASFHVN